MTKALRALIVGLMLSSILAACGGTQTADNSGASAAASTAASAAASAAVSAEPSEAASEAASAEPMESMAASEEASPSAEAEESAEASTDAEASAEATGTAAEAITLPEVVPADAQGTVVAAGSSTVFPLAQAIAERWQEEGGPPPTIDSVGTGGGFERFCVAAETDIANASRPINDEERQQCTDNGREPIEFRVGTDALAIVVSSENDFLEEVTTEELAQIFSTAENWSDIRPEYPNEPIQRFVPGTDSGTFDYFVEEIFDEDEAPILAAANLQQSEDDNVLVQGIEGSPNAIGFFGYAYYQENQDRLKILTVDGVEPTEETAEDNSYPLSRPLFIYSAQSVMDEKLNVDAFINYFLTNVNDVITEVGYFPASEEALNEAKQNFLDATGQEAQ